MIIFLNRAIKTDFSTKRRAAECVLPWQCALWPAGGVHTHIPNFHHLALLQHARLLLLQLHQRQ